VHLHAGDITTERNKVITSFTQAWRGTDHEYEEMLFYTHPALGLLEVLPSSGVMQFIPESVM